MDENYQAEDAVLDAQDNALQSLGQRMMNPKLMALRAQNPFIQIMPFPNTTLGFLLVSNTPQDINVPSEAKVVKFTGNGEYYVSRKGNAQVPDGVDKLTGSIMNPEGVYYYVEEVQQLSIVSPGAVRVTVEFFSQL
jgi:hypothetical protein